MQIYSGQITPGPSLFQALQSGPKPPVGQDANPVAETQQASAVQAGESGERPGLPDRDGDADDGRRGRLVDLKV
jgi:hypothetical protein